MRFYRKYIFLVFTGLALLLPCERIFAQFDEPYEEDTRSDTQLWLDYNPSLYLRPHYRFSGMINARTIYPSEWHRYAVRLNFRFTPKKIFDRMLPAQIFEFHFGLGYFYTNNFDADDISELRPYQGLMASWPNRRNFILIHYLRMEERLEKDLDTGFFDYTGRLRYRFGANMNLKGAMLTHFYIPWNVEFFFNLEGGIQFNDVFRATGGIGSYLGDDIRLEALASYHNTNDTYEGVRKTHDFVVRVRLRHNMDWYPKGGLGDVTE